MASQGLDFPAEARDTESARGAIPRPSCERRRSGGQPIPRRLSRVCFPHSLSLPKICPHRARTRAATIPLETAGRRQISAFLDRRQQKALISKIYNFGIGRDIVEFNPCHGVPMPAKARQRDRVLSEDEIRAVWQMLDHEELLMATTFKMQLVTAQRGLEVLSMRWQDIDGDWWNISS